MKTNLKRLEKIDIELFYVASIWKHEITLQGKISSELIKYCVNELGVKFEINEIGWLQGQNENIKITLV